MKKWLIVCALALLPLEAEAFPMYLPFYKAFYFHLILSPIDLRRSSPMMVAPRFAQREGLR